MNALLSDYTRKISFCIKNLLFVPLAIAIVVIVRIIKPFIYIRFGAISVSELGHFVDDSGLLLAEKVENIKEIDSNNIVDLYCWATSDVCNYQLEKMVRRVFYVRWWVKYLFIANNILPGGVGHSKLMPRMLQGSRDIEGLIYRTRHNKDAYLPFTEQENYLGRQYLSDIGMGDNDKYICVNIRDSAYKEKSKPNRDWSYHNFRNSDIESYLLAAEKMTDMGYWVIRTGKYPLKRLESINNKIVDYAFSDKQNDLLDIWLMANCEFCVSTGTGLDSVATTFRRPIIFVNYLPYEDYTSYAYSITTFKHLFWEDSGNRLTLSESIKNSYYRTNEYSENNIIINDLSDEEIRDAVVEGELYVNGMYEASSKDITNQVLFREILLDPDNHTYDLSRKHKVIHPDSLVSYCLLRKNWERLS